MSVDLSSLNAPQREAVLATEGPLLVLAGAGSGKTRVLTYRIAHLVEDLGVFPWSILAITFTNKAANEMRERLNTLVGTGARGMWVSTFHSMCGRILRANAELVGRTPEFTIYDTDDMKRLMKGVMSDLELNPKIYQPNALLNLISESKNNLESPDDLAARARDPIRKAAAQAYELVERRLAQANALDFDDMLYFTWRLFKKHPEVLELYQQRFQYVLVDEYQDTNKAQYEITTMLSAATRNLMVVGDDDQSIYSWRGADIRNILSFEEDYPDAKVVKLEQNYRSTGNILAAANAVIANNRQRKEKRLFTSAPDGEKVAVYLASDERDEGRWIAGEIEKLRNAGYGYDDFAVFYRTNAQSRMLEDMLLRAGVPYRIVGGARFFERAEVRDVMAYLALVVNPADDVSARRVVNTPRRGIGDASIDRVAALRTDGQSFLDACRQAKDSGEFRPAVRRALSEFVGIIDECRSFSGELRALVELVIEKSGLIRALEAEGTDEARGRVENIRELLGVVDEFAETHEDEDTFFDAPSLASIAAAGAAHAIEGMVEADVVAEVASAVADAVADVVGVPVEVPVDTPAADAPPTRTFRGDSLADFVEWVRLRTDLDSMEEGGAAVTLMTVHAAKGLEFPVVFVAGMEESLFPHGVLFGSDSDLEEERRLAYVAITRAEQNCFLSYASSRFRNGKSEACRPSRFLRDIDQRFIQKVGNSSPTQNYASNGGGTFDSYATRGTFSNGSYANPFEPRRPMQSAAPRPVAQGPTRSPLDLNRPRKVATHTTPIASVTSLTYGGQLLTSGSRIAHERFGRGTITELEGHDDDARVKVHFDTVGDKTLLLKFAKFTLLPSDNG